MRPLCYFSPDTRPGYRFTYQPMTTTEKQFSSTSLLSTTSCFSTRATSDFDVLVAIFGYGVRDRSSDRWDESATRSVAANSLLSKVTRCRSLTRRLLKLRLRCLASFDSHGYSTNTYVGGHRLLAFRNKLNFNCFRFFLLFRCDGAVGVSSLLLCHSTWPPAFFLWTKRLVKDVPHKVSK